MRWRYCDGRGAGIGSPAIEVVGRRPSGRLIEGPRALARRSRPIPLAAPGSLGALQRLLTVTSGAGIRIQSASDVVRAYRKPGDLTIRLAAAEALRQHGWFAALTVADEVEAMMSANDADLGSVVVLGREELGRGTDTGHLLGPAPLVAGMQAGWRASGAKGRLGFLKAEPGQSAEDAIARLAAAGFDGL